MKTAPGVRETTFEAAVDDEVSINIDFSNLVGQHGAIVVADCVFTATANFTKISHTWSAGDTYLSVLMRMPDFPTSDARALILSIKFTAQAELLHFEVHMTVTT